MITLRLKHTKAGKTQRVTLPAWAENALLEWLKIREKQELKGNWLWTHTLKSGRVKRICSNGIYNAFVRYGRECGLRVTPHCGRHTIGTKLARAKESPYRIQEALRHSSINTSLNYIHTFEDIEHGPLTDLLYSTKIHAVK